MPPSVREYFQHILDEIRYVQSSAHGFDKSTFLEDETRKRAYVRSIEIIGVWDVITNKFPVLEQDIRQIVVHEYS